jgi:hypothetical protein
LFESKKSIPIITVGIKTIRDSKTEKISVSSPAAMKRGPPSLSFFQAIVVRIIKIKLGIRCIIRAKNHLGSPKTSKANRLMKIMNKIERTRGSQYKKFFMV